MNESFPVEVKKITAREMRNCICRSCKDKSAFVTVTFMPKYPNAKEQIWYVCPECADAFVSGKMS